MVFLGFLGEGLVSLGCLGSLGEGCWSGDVWEDWCLWGPWGKVALYFGERVAVPGVPALGDL